MKEQDEKPKQSEQPDVIPAPWPGEPPFAPRPDTVTPGPKPGEETTVPWVR